jgi:hypothetical protein
VRSSRSFILRPMPNTMTTLRMEASLPAATRRGNLCGNPLIPNNISQRFAKHRNPAKLLILRALTIRNQEVAGSIPAGGSKDQSVAVNSPREASRPRAPCVLCTRIVLWGTAQWYNSGWKSTTRSTTLSMRPSRLVAGARPHMARPAAVARRAGADKSPTPGLRAAFSLA